MGDQQHSAARRRGLLKEQLQKGRLGVGIERRGGLVGYDQRRRSDQRARGGNPLLLSDAQPACGLAEKIWRQPQRGGKPGSFGGGVGHSGAPGRRKAQREADIIRHPRVRQEVKLLKDHPDMLGAEPVALAWAERIQRRARHRDPPLLRGEGAANERQKRRFPRSAGPQKQKPLARSEGQLGDLKRKTGLARPPEP